MQWVSQLVSLVCVLSTVAAEGDSAASSQSSKRGDLDRFEDEATRHEKHGKPDASEKCEEADEGIEDGFLWELGRLTFYSGVYGGIGSWVRVHGGSSAEWEKEFPRRATGDPLIPFFAAEGLYQDADRDISATSLHTEVGYGPLGFEYRATRFRERSPEDTMTLTQAHVLYRMSFSRYVGINIGAGRATLEGNRGTSGFSLAVPVQVYPWRSLGMEFRPAWAWIRDNTLSEYSLVLAARHSVVSIRAGYRWISTGARVLDGPVVGAAIHF